MICLARQFLTQTSLGLRDAVHSSRRGLRLRSLLRGAACSCRNSPSKMRPTPLAISFLVVTLVLGIATRSAAVADERYALVIGNSNYQRSPFLKNPVNDARDIADRLQSLGFRLVGGAAQLNVKHEQLLRMVRQLADSALHPSDTLLFYFAGHGVAFAGDNWLVPVDDSDIRNQDDVQDFAASTRSIAEKLNQRHAGVTILILDACRDNPLPAKSRSMTRGLARIDVPRGTFVLYAASPGQVAIDGNGRNGLFTEALLPLLSEPGYSLERIYYRLLEEVSNRSGGQQEPMAELKLTAPFEFVPKIDNADRNISTESASRAPAAATEEQSSSEDGKILCILPDKSPKVVKTREQCRSLRGLVYQ
jgi:uncharacterized caspase-like protein